MTGHHPYPGSRLPLWMRVALAPVLAILLVGWAIVALVSLVLPPVRRLPYE